MHGRIWMIGLVCTLLGGCSETPAPPRSTAEEPASVLAQAFDVATTGTIRGQVAWDGTVPVAESTVVREIAFHPGLHNNPVRYETPHVPRVHPKTQGVADAVVYLRGVDLRRSRPWDHPPVRVAYRDRRLLIEQGGDATSVGFVRRGDPVSAVNHGPDYHALRGRGASFFTLPLIERDQSSVTRLKQNGVVELTDAAGYYWLHAHLFVDEHPYYARTDAEGKFVLEHVPAGTYEIVSWMPSWHVERRERDPETAVAVRTIWAAPCERKQTIQVDAGQTHAASIRWSQAMFPDSGNGR